MKKIIMINNSVDLLYFKSEDAVGIAHIRFENDPITGYFFKCPNCGKISDIEGEKLPSTLICENEMCRNKIEIDIGTE